MKRITKSLGLEIIGLKELNQPIPVVNENGKNPLENAKIKAKAYYKAFSMPVFCYKCDMDTRTFSYHIACENKLNASSSEFEELKLEALTYARFENNCTNAEQRFAQYNALCEEIWGQWLPDSNYISLIEPENFGCVDGYALLEIYNPENPTSDAYNLEMLLPIKRK